VKPGNNRATNFPVDTREYLRETLYGVQRGVDRRKKFLTKAGALPFVHSWRLAYHYYFLRVNVTAQARGLSSSPGAGGSAVIFSLP